MNASDTDGIDPAHIFDSLGTPAWFADKDKTLRYVNAAGQSNQSIVAALGRNIEDCHKPGSVKDLRALYEKWAAGSREAQVYLRTAGRATKYNVLIPVHGPKGFEGVVELSFKTGEA